MLSFIKYLEVIWHDEIQNKKKTEDVNNDCLKSFSLENATTSIPWNILITLIITPMAGVFFSIFELFWVIFRAVTGNAFFQQKSHVASFKFRIFILKLSTSKFDYSSILNAIVTLWSILVQSNFILLEFFGRNAPTWLFKYAMTT